MIYLDHNATTPLDDRVLEAMQPFQNGGFGNPSTLYRVGRLARDAVEQARAQVAELIDAQPGQVIFTGGGTESNNLALKGFCFKQSQPGILVIGATEHDSVLKPAQFLEHFGWEKRLIAVDENGLINFQALVAEKVKHPKLVSVMMANNETGVLQDVEQLAGVVRDTGAIVHTDAVQVVGKMRVSFRQSGVHMMSLSAHKLYGPKGCGALIVDRSLALEPLLHGGGQERNLRSGTENVAAIVGFGKAAELAYEEMSLREKNLLSLRAKLEAGLSKIDGVEIFAHKSERLPNTVQVGVTGMDGEMLLMEMDRRGIAVSSGSACSTEGKEPSHVLLAMGIAPDLARSAIRVSLGAGNSEQDVEAFLRSLEEIVDRRRIGF